MLHVKNIDVSYGPVRALKDVTLRVQPGQIVALLGANGAGKTTTLRAVSRVVPVRRGRIEFDGANLLELPPSDVVALGVAHVPEGRRIFGELTVMENLDMGAYSVSSAARRKQALERAFHFFPILADRRGQKGATLSGGEQQMLAVARALMSDPRMLLLDEPSLGLAPMLVDQVFGIIRKINQEEGVSVLLVEQNANEALLHADWAYVLENGSVTLEGPAQHLRQDPRVIAAYLGA